MSLPEPAVSTKKIIFSSKDNPADSPHNFTINFANSTVTTGHILKILPLDIQIQNLFNNVTEGNRTVIMWDVTAAQFFNYDLPVGRYSVDSFMTELQAQVLANGAAIAKIDSWQIVPNTNTLEVSYIGGDAYIAGGTAEMDRMLGIGATPTPGATQTMDYPPQFQGVEQVLVESRISNANTVLGNNQTNLPIVAYVALSDTCYGSTVHYKVRDETVRAFNFPSTANLNTINIRLLDIQGNLLTLPENAVTSMSWRVYYGRNDIF